MTTQLPKAKCREILFLLLYAQDFTKEEDLAQVQFISDELKVGARHVRALLPILALVKEKVEELDKQIEKVSTEYELSRIPKVEINILRLALYELFFDDSIPPQVAITEGIRLARKFGNQECYKFVNAILDTLHQEKLTNV
ncbi:MAG: transcription antitermination factor NusB [Rhabdochlamydiaceae bacterium]|nr:transcription antitermination factor NusB [Candidatus Amphrikana amoebophyrae]